MYDIGSPEYVGMGVVGFKDGIENTPVNVCSLSFEGNTSLLSDSTISSVGSDKVLGSDDFLLASILVYQCNANWVAVVA